MVLTHGVLTCVYTYETTQFKGVAPPAGKHHTPRNTDSLSLDAIGNYGTTGADASKQAGVSLGQIDPVYFFNLEDGEGISDVCCIC